MSGTEQSNQEFPEWIKHGFIALLIMAALLLIIYFLNFNSSWGDQATFGAFGDFFGGTLNPILGFATVALLVWSLRLQSAELKTSNDTLKATKEETELSRKAMEAQVKHFEEQAKLSELDRLLNEQMAFFDKLLNRNIADIESYYKALGISSTICSSVSFYDAIFGTSHLFKNQADTTKSNLFLMRVYSGGDTVNIRDEELMNQAAYTLLNLCVLYFTYANLSKSIEFVNTHYRQIRRLLFNFHLATHEEQILSALEKLEEHKNSFIKLHK